MHNLLKPPFNSHKDHFIGNLLAPIEIVQYGDFQCEHCGEAYMSIKLLRNWLGQDLRFVFRHFAMPMLHSLTLEAAVASEVAALKGRFWEMHDLIFENQCYLVKSCFSRFAEEIGVNSSAYENRTDYRRLTNKILNDFHGAVKAGVDSTPTFFINGRKYIGFHDFRSLFQACEYILRASKTGLGVVPERP